MKILLVFFSALTTIVLGGGLNFFLQNPGLGEWNADDISGEACTGLVRGEEGVCVMTYQCLRAKGSIYFHNIIFLLIFRKKAISFQGSTFLEKGSQSLINLAEK